MPKIEKESVYVALTRVRSDGDLRLWPMGMEAHHIKHLTDFDYEEKLKM
jgi:hypothetical protein